MGVRTWGRFDYLLEKVRGASFTETPFRHIEILNFFTPSDFDQIVKAPEIDIPVQSSDEAVFGALAERSYKIIEFPGCIVDKEAYLKWHREKAADYRTNTSCEGFGITLRLMKPQSPVVTDLFEFLNADPFRQVLAEKFGIALADVFYDGGIQKYLDGYEISPHPDIRRKAATFMVNINTGEGSENREHHTHYMRFKSARKYVQSYWEGRTCEDRCWVPWEWCDTVKEQQTNNSIVLFSPANDTLHAVRAKYDHLQGQRTQLYGNLWYHQVPVSAGPQWEEFDIRPRPAVVPTTSMKERLKVVVPRSIVNMVKGTLGRGRKDEVISDRLAGK